MASSDIKTMKAWTYTSTTGGLEKNLRSVADASPPFSQTLPGDAILVRVRYASLNPADHKLPEVPVLGRVVIPPPASPGMDFAGEVAQTGGAASDDFAVGDEVFGRVAATRFGALGEYVVARRDGLAKVPSGVSLADASCVGTAGQTAYQCIAPYVAHGAGDWVFVNGGSGGTGTFGIQIAKAVGCRVVASCSGRNADLCRSLGADEVIDYTAENVSAVLKAKGQVFKLVVDNVGSAPTDLYKAADHYLLPEGRFVQIGGETSLADVTSILSRGFLPSILGGGKRKWEYLVTKNVHEDLDQIAEWMKEGKVKAVIDETFEYENAPKAVEKLKTGRARGKIVVKGSS
ncbi:hypothetical protein M426DRAFT_322413 [Hypoxylon sp. CI-4A]|nr:hypothetical protein M426DRAFT_322413 [Hypoxylon sp. CI-4A]